MSESSSDRTVAPKQLVALIKDADQKKTKMQSIAGEIGARVKAAVENGNMHRGAYALMVRLYRMDEERRNDFIRSIQLYLDICAEEGLFGDEHVGDLADMAASEVPADDDDDPRPAFLKNKGADSDADHVATNVERLGGINGLPGADAKPH